MFNNHAPATGEHHASHPSLAFVLSRDHLVDAVFRLGIVEQLLSDLHLLAAVDCRRNFSRNRAGLLRLAAVFTPVAFTTGRTGKLFIEFALTLAGAVIISGFVALTLSPMMCSLLLKHNPKPNLLVRTIDRSMAGLANAYAGLLRITLRHRWIVLLIGAAVAYASFYLWNTTKKELAPIEDRGTIVSIFNGPDGASVDYTQKYG